MPVYKALILNKEISVNYEDDQKEKLVEAIKEINSKLEGYDNRNGKISDTKLLSFLAIKIQAELLEINENKNRENSLEKKIKDSSSENINLNDKLYDLREQNKLLKEENDSISQHLIQIQKQIGIITRLIKKTYEE